MNDIEYKWCCDCDEWFPMDNKNFKVQASQKDGYSSRCISCQMIYNHQSYMNNRDIELEKSKQRQKDNWEHYKKLQSAWIKKNRDYVNQRFEKWEEDHPERKEYKSKYQQNNPYKMQQYSKKRYEKKHIITDGEWIACKDYFKDENDEWACAYCGKPISKNIKKYKGELKQFDLEKEHVIDDGRNDIKNCIPSCTTCNSKKKRRTLNEFYNPKNKNYTYERYHKIYMWIRYDCKKYIQKKKPKGKYTRKT